MPPCTIPFNSTLISVTSSPPAPPPCVLTVPNNSSACKIEKLYATHAIPECISDNAAFHLQRHHLQGAPNYSTQHITVVQAVILLWELHEVNQWIFHKNQRKRVAIRSPVKQNNTTESKSKVVYLCGQHMPTS
jgi:hypothetical protein